MICDTYLSARELVREVDYTLKTLARSLLQQDRGELAASDVPGADVFAGSRHSLPWILYVFRVHILCALWD